MSALLSSTGLKIATGIRRPMPLQAAKALSGKI
jgi:hypothetical protein